MLKKLIKHELRATGRVMLPMLGVVLALSVISALSMRFNGLREGFFPAMITVLTVAAYFLSLLAAGVLCLVIMIRRFYRNLLGDEGYVMMTLPVSLHSQLWAKLLVSLLWIITTGLVMVLAVSTTVFIVSETNVAAVFSRLPSLGELFDGIGEELGLLRGHVTVLSLTWVLVALATTLESCLHFYAAMAIGHSFARHKGLWSVVFFVVINFALSMLGGALAVFGVALPSMGRLALYNSASAFVYTFSFGMLLYVVLIGGLLYLLTYLFMKKHLNLA